jgi:hypothetical protein
MKAYLHVAGAQFLLVSSSQKIFPTLDAHVWCGLTPADEVLCCGKFHTCIFLPSDQGCQHAGSPMLFVTSQRKLLQGRYFQRHCSIHAAAHSSPLRDQQVQPPAPNKQLCCLSLAAFLFMVSPKL